MHTGHLSDHVISEVIQDSPKPVYWGGSHRRSPSVAAVNLKDGSARGSGGAVI
jgi:hypothetical protein